MPNSIHIPRSEVGARTLADTPKRAFTFIRTLGVNSDLRALMREHGYSQEDHLEGWSLLFAASGNSGESFLKAPAAEAIRELDAWDEVGFHKAHAALGRKFPTQAEFVFDELAPTQGPTAVIGVKKFLDRLDALEKGDGRDATHDEDLKALEILAKRGFDATERARLRELVLLAQSDPAAAKESVPASPREKDLFDLYAWYQEWAEVARAVVTSRTDRILLGLAKRKSRDASEEDEPESSPDVAAVETNGTAPAPNVNASVPVANGPVQ